ncbi:MAG: transcriptional repressor [Planctomycetes bacterium]|nr:transcriptional repressor [Planctomycetota bacterium]
MNADETARNILRRAGLRVTITRATLVASMLDAHEPVSMEDAVRLCGQNGGDPATIYRNLQALTEAGVLQPVRGVGRREMFELTDGHVHEAPHHHAHASCTKCGRVECIDMAELPDKPPAPKGWSVEDLTVTVWGLCPDCR